MEDGRMGEREGVTAGMRINRASFPHLTPTTSIVLILMLYQGSRLEWYLQYPVIQQTTIVQYICNIPKRKSITC